jgi:CheY-like chemotaxis protein
VRSYLRMMLVGAANLGVVAEAADGSEVLGARDLHRPDVVLMDIRMPQLDGIATTRLLAAPSDAPTVLVLTTSDADELVLRAALAGAAFCSTTPRRRRVARDRSPVAACWARRPRLEFARTPARLTMSYGNRWPHRRQSSANKRRSRGRIEQHLRDSQADQLGDPWPLGPRRTQELIRQDDSPMRSVSRQGGHEASNVDEPEHRPVFDTSLPRPATPRQFKINRPAWHSPSIAAGTFGGLVAREQPWRP